VEVVVTVVAATGASEPRRQEHALESLEGTGVHFETKVGSVDIVLFKRSWGIPVIVGMTRSRLLLPKGKLGFRVGTTVVIVVVVVFV